MSTTSLKKGDTVILHMFTGIAVGLKTILAADKTTVTIETGKGMTIFSKKTGKQIEPEAKSERFANYITEDDGSYVPTKKSAPAKKTTKKVAKKEKSEPEEDFEEEDYEEAEEEEAPKPKKKVKK